MSVVGNDVIFLDPHTTQSIGVVESKEQEHERKMDSSYHCQQANRLHILHMDPSVAVVSYGSLCFCFVFQYTIMWIVSPTEHKWFQSFFCRTEADFDSLCALIKEHMVTPDKQPMFEIVDERQQHWTPAPTTATGVEEMAQDSLGATACSCELYCISVCSFIICTFKVYFCNIHAKINFFNIEFIPFPSLSFFQEFLFTLNETHFK